MDASELSSERGRLEKWAGAWSGIVEGREQKWKGEEASGAHHKNVAALHHHWQHLSAPAAVIVPLAGDTPAVDSLLERGHHVTAVEIVPAAVDRLVERVSGACGTQVERGEAEGGVVVVRTGRLTVLQCDLFALPLAAAPAASFDLVYDRASLTAIPPDQRCAYADLLARLLKPASGVYFLDCIDRSLLPEEQQAKGPPWHTDDAEVERVYVGEGRPFSLERKLEPEEVERWIKRHYFLRLASSST
eukprot:TRINITY_DN5795_c0_g1_i5.p1 TRINITY_DN5795_c0_g1~~TRINITY_DN5795_c0_g1_i5.p1  ORF type:complete len:265 (-),score=98.09 TRINITY_DN5795_c0_g1_i5:417-1154(-)